jgi:putative membrane protein
MVAMVKLTENDRARIADAIRAAESRTTGEIVAVVAGASDRYYFIPTLWAAAAGLLVAPLVWLAGLAWGVPEVSVAQLAVFMALYPLLRWRPVCMAVVPGAVKRMRAARLAREQFFARDLHLTEGRTGILIFVSVAEHYVEILADTGIDAKVDSAVWQGAVDGFVTAVKAGRVADGFVATIGACGAVLAEHFPSQGRNPDELPNRLYEM